MQIYLKFQSITKQLLNYHRVTKNNFFFYLSFVLLANHDKQKRKNTINMKAPKLDFKLTSIGMGVPDISIKR